MNERGDKGSSVFHSPVGRNLSDIVGPCGSPRNPKKKKKSTCLPEMLSLAPCSRARNTKRPDEGRRRQRIKIPTQIKRTNKGEKKDPKKSKNKLVGREKPLFKHLLADPCRFVHNISGRFLFFSFSSRHHFGDQTWPQRNNVFIFAWRIIMIAFGT